MTVPSILLGQLWKLNDTGDTWIVTKTYSEAFTAYAMLRKVGNTSADVRRVKVEKSSEGATLPGFTFAQESEGF